MRSAKEISIQLDELDNSQRYSINRCGFAVIDIIGFSSLYLLNKLMGGSDLDFGNILVYFLGLFAWHCCAFQVRQHIRQRITLEALRNGLWRPTLGNPFARQ